MDAELKCKGHVWQKKRYSVHRSHQQEDAEKASPAVRDRVVFCAENGADDEHDDVAREVAVGGSPVGVFRHEEHDDDCRHDEAGKRDPYGPVGLA